jgi:predicted AAA+ superfamily ATPase
MKYGNLSVFKQPMCLIRNDGNETLALVEDVLQEISTIDNTVNVIAIAGPYRTGKSYLLNKLAGRKQGKKSLLANFTVHTETDDQS